MSDPTRHGIISKSHIQAIDRDYWSPNERAMGVHQIFWSALQEHEAREGSGPTNWDVFCWAIEYANQLALGFGNDALIQAVRETNRLVYSIHYTNAAELYGVPDKRRETRRQRADAARQHPHQVQGGEEVGRGQNGDGDIDWRVDGSE